MLFDWSRHLSEVELPDQIGERECEYPALQLDWTAIQSDAIPHLRSEVLAAGFQATEVGDVSGELDFDRNEPALESQHEVDFGAGLRPVKMRFRGRVPELRE